MNEDEIWVQTELVAADSTCVRRQVGAALMSASGELMSLGFNTERMRLRCDKGECPRGRLTHEEKPSGTEPFDDCIAEHAEQVCLSDWLFVSLEGCTLYVTDTPCDDCRDYIFGNWPGLRSGPPDAPPCGCPCSTIDPSFSPRAACSDCVRTIPGRKIRGGCRDRSSTVDSIPTWARPPSTIRGILPPRLARTCSA